jgi:hypothetical protein
VAQHLVVVVESDMRRRWHGRSRVLRPQAPRDSVDDRSIEDGGLGLDYATAAEIVGHDDNGYLIATVYTKLNQRRAIERAQRAMDAYKQRRDSANAEPPSLTVVQEAP